MGYSGATFSMRRVQAPHVHNHHFFSLHAFRIFLGTLFVADLFTRKFDQNMQSATCFEPNGWVIWAGETERAVSCDYTHRKVTGLGLLGVCSFGLWLVAPAPQKRAYHALHVART